MIGNILFLSSGLQKIFEPLVPCFTILFVLRYVPVYCHKRGSSLLLAHGACLITWQPSLSTLSRKL